MKLPILIVFLTLVCSSLHAQKKNKRKKRADKFCSVEIDTSNQKKSIKYDFRRNVNMFDCQPEKPILYRRPLSFQNTIDQHYNNTPLKAGSKLIYQLEDGTTLELETATAVLPEVKIYQRQTMNIVEHHYVYYCSFEITLEQIEQLAQSRPVSIRNSPPLGKEEERTKNH